MTSWSLAARLGVRCLLQNSRHYSRKVVRRPIRVLSEEEASIGRTRHVSIPTLEEMVSAANPKASESGQDSEGEPVLLGSDHKKSRVPSGFPTYVIQGENDADLCRFMLETSSKKKRLKSGLIMLEGKRLIQEALSAQLRPRALFFSRLEDVTSLPLPNCNFVFQKITFAKLKRWSKLTTTPGLIGFFKRPDTNCKRSVASLPYTVICDNIRDPGNLGSILRVAASAGSKEVILVKGCVDLWNDKVLRSAMGSHFHIRIREDVLWDDIEKQLEPDAFIMFADNNDVISTASDEIIRDDVSDESDVKSSTESEALKAVDTTEQESNVNSEFALENFPIIPYYSVDYTQMKNLYLILGGERGFSQSAVNLGKSQKKFRTNIPMLNEVESLNVSSALAVLAHEIKRQHHIFGDGDVVESVSMPSV